MFYGYLDPEYAGSLKEFGVPCQLPRSGAWVLERPIPGSPYRDAMGCYPLLACQDWTKLPEDLAALGEKWVSLSFVADPFGDFDPADLQSYFTDVFFPFKQHYVIDLDLPLDEIGGQRRRKHARRALRQVEIEITEDPIRYKDDWTDLYGNLIRKHNIQGIRKFSPQSFQKLLSIPGAVLIRALIDGKTVGAQIYLVQKDVVHVHLGASTEQGYEIGITYALEWASLEYFKGKARWLNLGGGVGISGSEADGLGQYKSGWATGTRWTYFCGRVFNRAQYDELTHARGIGATAYFPAYRQGEFG
jgi:hypothetical protein